MDAAADVLLALTAPEPVVRYVEQRVRSAGLRVARVPATATVLRVSAPSATLEREAELLRGDLRIPLRVLHQQPSVGMLQELLRDLGKLTMFGFFFPKDINLG